MNPHFVQILTGVRIPHLVSDLPNPPSILYLVGELPRGPRIAVIGTRRPTDEAVEFTSTLVTGLAMAGYSIWSGGAEGIDAAAHRAALRSGAKTVVVAPAGWERPYPENHAELYREVIGAGGGYLSLVPPERVAHRHQFFARNALLVVLTQAVVVVQAGFRSGARNAAKAARQLGRPVFAVPSCPWVHQGAGCNLEIKLGARPIGSAKEVLRGLASVLGWSDAVTLPSRDDEFLGEPGVAITRESRSETESTAAAAPVEQARRSAGARRSSELRHRDGQTQLCERERRRGTTDGAPTISALDAELNTLLVAVSEGATSIDALCHRTGWPAAVVQSDVLRLTLQGRIRVGRSGAIEIVSG